MSRTRRIVLLWVLTALAAAGVFLFAPPIPQDPAYHLLADGRGWLGIPNFGNVMSNMAFPLVGIAGLGALWRGWFGVPSMGEGDPLPLVYFFVGVALVGPGSAWYHLDPDNATSYEGRRTNAAAGQRYLYFDAAPRFAAGDVPVAVKITFRDRGASAWALEYATARGNARSASVIGSPMVRSASMVNELGTCCSGM